MGLTLQEISLLVDAIKAHGEAQRAEIFTALPGEVVDFSEGVASVRPMITRPTRTASGAPASEPLPVLPGVRVMFPTAGGVYINFPIPKGTTGLIVFSTYSLQTWLASGRVSDPGDVRPHHPANAVFVPGLLPDTVKAPDDATELTIEGSPTFKLGKDATDRVALANVLQTYLDAIKATLTGGITAGSPPAFAVPYADPGTDIASAKVKVEP